MGTVSTTKHLLASVLGVLVWLCCLPAHAEMGTSQMNQFFDGLESFAADFEQRIIDVKGDEVQHASGRVVIHRPGRFRWDYLDPYKQLLLGDGERLWHYDADLAQATVSPMGETLTGTPAMLLSDTRKPDELFDVTELVRPNITGWVELHPHAVDAQFSIIRMAFHKGNLRIMELVDAFQQTTRIEFFRMKRNAPIDEALFSFEPPEGVDIIGDWVRQE